MVGDDQQIGRRAKRKIRIGEKAGIDVTMGADERQSGYGLIEFLGDPFLGCVRPEITIFR